MASGFGAGRGADMLQDVLRRKLVEQAQMAQQQQQAAKLAEEIRQADMQNAVQQRSLGQGDQRIGLDRDALKQRGEQFGVEAGFKERGLKLDEGLQPVRIENLTAQTGEIRRRPTAEKEQRDFTTGRDTAQGVQRMREIGAQGENALRVANIRHPDPAGTAQTQKEQNEVEDSLSLIDEIRNDKALSTSTGPIQGRGWGAVQDLEGFTRVKARHDNLVNKMQLAQAGKLKGQGQISNMEREMLKNAATALDLKLGDPDYLTELAKVEAQFKRMLTGNAGGGAATPEFDYVPGKGLVPRKPK